MLNKERIKEAEGNVTSYLEDGLLKKSAIDKQVINILLRNAKESLRVAEEIHQKTSLICGLLFAHITQCITMLMQSS